MLCPECGDLAPPGPLDVRKCAPQFQSRKRLSPSISSRILRWLTLARSE